jgi:hypothetical protein
LRRSWGCVALLAATACSSSYLPARSPRVATVWSGGNVSYYRDGVEYPSGFFLGGVEDAVTGNPHAEDEARTAHHLMIGGLSCELVGAGTIGAGVGLVAGNHPSDAARNTGAGLLVGGLVLDLVGVILVANAIPHSYDAVNIYNDGIPPFVGPPWPGPPPQAPGPPNVPSSLPVAPSPPR